jgi:hypothetical protein
VFLEMSILSDLNTAEPAEEVPPRPEYSCDQGLLFRTHRLEQEMQKAIELANIPIIRDLPALLLLRKDDAGSQ